MKGTKLDLCQFSQYYIFGLGNPAKTVSDGFFESCQVWDGNSEEAFLLSKEPFCRHSKAAGNVRGSRDVAEVEDKNRKAGDSGHPKVICCEFDIESQRLRD